jgi:hypothetical protein
MKIRYLAFVALGFRLGRVRLSRAPVERLLARIAIDDRIPGWRWKLAARVQQLVALIDPDGPSVAERQSVVGGLFGIDPDWPICPDCRCRHLPDPSHCVRRRSR